MNYLVYKHTSPSGKSYIGLTKDLSQRNMNHRNPNSRCAAFRAAIKKYGWDAFTHEVLEDGIATLDEAKQREVALIAEHQTMYPYGYNLTAGGEGSSQSEASIRNRKAAWERRTPEERCAIFEKVRAATSQKTPEEKQSISARRLASFHSHTSEEKAEWYAKRAKTRDEWSDEQRAALSQKIKAARRKTLATKVVYIATDPSGVEYPITNMLEFCRERGLNNRSMSLVVNGKYSHHKGWRCRRI